MPSVDLGALKDRLGRESDLRLAVLFGSRARGDERPDSDIDLLAVFRKNSFARRLDLASRLEDELGLPVQIVDLGAARHAPVLLADAIEDGCVLVDRDDVWPDLIAEYPAIASAAIKADADLRVRAQAALAELASASA